MSVMSVLFLFGLASCGTKEEKQVEAPKASKTVRVTAPRELSLPERSPQQTFEARFRLNARFTPENTKTQN